MDKRGEGSIIFMMLGFLWLMGIIVAVAYTMVAHIANIAHLRGLQARYQYALEGGMVTALANIEDQSEAYVAVQSQVLYEGPWPVDERHPALGIKLELVSQSAGSGDHNMQFFRLIGTLFEDKKELLTVVWHLEYNQKALRWRYLWGERIYI